jgi:hypothetical protein
MNGLNLTVENDIPTAITHSEEKIPPLGLGQIEGWMDINAIITTLLWLEI